jgi:HD-like signal output (HDOD) protein
VGVAIASANLVEFLNLPLADQVYSCGLIHDIGKLAKLKYDQESICVELKRAGESKLNNHQIEITQNGIRHDLPRWRDLQRMGYFPSCWSSSKMAP